MKKILTAVFAAGLALAAASIAEARNGCSRGFHRIDNGHCIPNRALRGLAAPGLEIGKFYSGRGYWDGHRYWQRREWEHRHRERRHWDRHHRHHY